MWRWGSFELTCDAPTGTHSSRPSLSFLSSFSRLLHLLFFPPLPSPSTTHLFFPFPFHPFSFTFLCEIWWNRIPLVKVLGVDIMSYITLSPFSVLYLRYCNKIILNLSHLNNETLSNQAGKSIIEVNFSLRLIHEVFKRHEHADLDIHE